ncbi:MAG: hypothetical protein ACLS7Z_08150 [Christensenellales bacterium]
MPLDAHATEEEDKLILLSSLSRLGGCTQEQLLRFLVENALMNHQFYLALGGLERGGLHSRGAPSGGNAADSDRRGESVEMFASASALLRRRS